MVAGALDEGRIGGFERQHAMLCHIYGMLESAATDNGHDLAWEWPLLGLSDPDARPDFHGRRPKPSLSCHRLAQGSGRARAHWKGNARSQEREPFRRRQVSRVKQQGQGGKGAKAKEGGATQDWVATIMTLALLAFALGHDASRQIKVGGLRSLH